jgi:uncharacterized Fe-S cluster-containing protein
MRHVEEVCALYRGSLCIILKGSVHHIKGVYASYRGGLCIVVETNGYLMRRWIGEVVSNTCKVHQCNTQHTASWFAPFFPPA